MCFTLLSDDEKWTAIEGYVGHYSISNMGRVYSHFGKGRLLKACPNNTAGYLIVDLCKDGIKKKECIHVLVGNAFVGKRENGLTFDHIDRNNQNNCASNIRLATKSEQSENRNVQKNNKLGEKNISINRNRYRIDIQRNKKLVFSKCYPMEKYTLEDCVRIRDEFLNV